MTTEASLNWEMPPSQRELGVDAKLQENVKLHLCGSMIAFALGSAFHEEIESFPRASRRTQSLQEVFVPVNDYVDIGLALSIVRENGGLRNNYVPSAMLENHLRSRFQVQRERHIAQFGDEGVIDAVYQDSMVLGENHHKFSGKRLGVYWEIDSAIHEIAFVEAVLPGKVKDLFGIPQQEGVEDIQELLGKYRPYLLCERDDLGDLGPDGRKLLGLHSLVMLLKLDDDNLDEGIDRALGLRNTRHIPEVGRLREHYERMSKAAGIGSLTRALARSGFRFASRVKLPRNEERPYKELYDGPRIIGPGYSNSVRQALYDSSLLPELLRVETF